MNENINLCEILKDCPKGTELWSPLFGIVKFGTIPFDDTVIVYTEDNKGYCFMPNGFIRLSSIDIITKESMLFPSKDQRDWSKWECPKIDKPKFDPKTLKPFDKVLVRDHNNDLWTSIHFSYIKNDCYLVICSSKAYRYCIPYNDDTKHLIGTTEEAPKYYRYWEN